MKIFIEVKSCNMDHKPNAETIINSKICVHSKSLQSCLRIPEWVAIPSCMGLPDSEIKPKSLMSPALGGGFFTNNARWEGQNT